MLLDGHHDVGGVEEAEGGEMMEKWAQNTRKPL